MAFRLESLLGGREEGDKTFLLALVLFGLYFLLRHRKQAEEKPAALPPPPAQAPPSQPYTEAPYYSAPEPSAQGGYLPPPYR